MSSIQRIRFTYVGHACVLIEIDGLRVLTDPLTRRRVGHLCRVAPPVEPASVTGIDLVLISHAHRDHLDVPSLRSLAGGPRVLCPTAASGPVAAAGHRPHELEPGAMIEHGPLRIEATPAEHDGRRSPLSRDSGALGFVIAGSAGSVYFAGDTGRFDGMAGIGPVDTALLPVAGWGPRVGAGHLDPVEAARAAAVIRPRTAIPIHWGTYSRMLMRAVEPVDRPAREFEAALAGLRPEIRALVIAPGGSAELEVEEGSRPRSRADVRSRGGGGRADTGIGD